MVASQHTQSLTDFRQKASETLDRINKTGAAEILTVNGEARAVIMAPDVFDRMAREAELTRDATIMRKAIQEMNDGKGVDIDEGFATIRARLLSRNKGRGTGAGK
jgi:PHD/YefM family antitoxin component YafN of YafNO toxin-antitoxin module